MIKYVELIKLADGTPPEKLGEIEGQLRALGKTVPEVKKWSCGRCLAPAGSAERWTLAIVANFKDERACERYREHPGPRAFDELIRPHRERSVSLPYEAHCPILGPIKFERGTPVPIGRSRLPPLQE